jgi:hypothetical protein
MAHNNTQDQQQSWRSPKVLGVIVISLGVVAVAQRDIQKRSSGEIHGPKLLWRLISLNALGALAYLKWGRSAH